MLSHYIIYPNDQKNTLDVVCTNSWEADDYRLASRREFCDLADAVEYAKELAEKNGLRYVGSETEEDGTQMKHSYLD